MSLPCINGYVFIAPNTKFSNTFITNNLFHYFKFKFCVESNRFSEIQKYQENGNCLSEDKALNLF